MRNICVHLWHLWQKLLTERWQRLRRENRGQGGANKSRIALNSAYSFLLKAPFILGTEGNTAIYRLHAFIASRPFSTVISQKSYINRKANL